MLTISRMKWGSFIILLPETFFILVSVFFCPKLTMGDPRIQTVKIICGNHGQQNAAAYIRSSVTAMGNLRNQVRNSGYGESVSGSAPYTTYGLAQCYGDLSSLDCVLCYSQARTILPQCYPSTAGRVYLDGCFARSENYNFYQEFSGPNDTAICGNRSRNEPAFQDAARKAVMQAVVNAPNDKGYAREKVLLTGERNESIYVLANCWESLNTSSCQACLKNASSKALGCLPMSEGRTLNTGCFIRYSDFDFLNKEPESGISKGTIIVIIVSIVSSLLLLAIGVLTGLYFWKLRRIQKRGQGSDDSEKIGQMLQDSSLNFKYKTLLRATKSFAEENKLGQGGYGTVYKGVLADGREIAVKRLFFNNKHRAADFYNEVNIISGLQHKNLVRLLGCSCSGPESLLVYEFLPNRSLDHFIFDPQLGRKLSWEKRYEILIGTAEGLDYLHENQKTKIVHRDIKSSNILLDSRFRAKIADFGLARTFQDDESHISTAIAGTLGYMAPEYLAHGQLTEKADVYSFGVVLLEMVTGRQTNKKITQVHSESLVATVWRHFRQRTLEKILDPSLTLPEDGDDSIKEEIKRVVHIGLLCTQEVPTLRPSMSRVVDMLKKKEGHLPAPTSPPFIDERTMELNDLRENPNCPLKADSSCSIATIGYSSSFSGR